MWLGCSDDAGGVTGQCGICRCAECAEALSLASAIVRTLRMVVRGWPVLPTPCRSRPARCEAPDTLRAARASVKPRSQCPARPSALPAGDGATASLPAACRFYAWLCAPAAAPGTGAAAARRLGRHPGRARCAAPRPPGPAPATAGPAPGGRTARRRGRARGPWRARSGWRHLEVISCWPFRQLGRKALASSSMLQEFGPSRAPCAKPTKGCQINVATEIHTISNITLM